MKLSDIGFLTLLGFGIGWSMCDVFFDRTPPIIQEKQSLESRLENLENRAYRSSN